MIQITQNPSAQNPKVPFPGLLRVICHIPHVHVILGFPLMLALGVIAYHSVITPRQLITDKSLCTNVYTCKNRNFRSVYCGITALFFRGNIL